MSGVGSMGAVPSSPPTATAPGSHPMAGRRSILAVLTLVVALALAATSAPGLIAAFSPAPSVSREALFEALKSRFRDYSTFEREIRLMEERIGVDGSYLTAIEETLGTQESGIAPTLASFAAIEAAADLRPGCRPADPWSASVSTARRDIDTSANGSMRVSLDLFFCLFDVPRYESGLVRYPIATVTLTADESRQTAALRSHITATDRDQALRWLQAVIVGEVGHLHRSIAERKVATETLSDQIDSSLRSYATTGSEHTGPTIALIQALLLLVMLALTATWMRLALADAGAPDRMQRHP